MNFFYLEEPNGQKPDKSFFSCHFLMISFTHYGTSRIVIKIANYDSCLLHFQILQVLQKKIVGQNEIRVFSYLTAIPVQSLLDKRKLWEKKRI